MRRISLSLLAGVAVVGATLVLLRGPSLGLNQPAGRETAQLVAVSPNRLSPNAPSRLATRKPGLVRFLARFIATHDLFGNPRSHPIAVPARPRIGPLRGQGMACPVATGSAPGGCSIVPCAVYVGAGQTYAVTSGPGAGLAILPSVTARPSPGGSTPAGTCVSRPGRPPQMRWASSAAP